MAGGPDADLNKALNATVFFGSKSPIISNAARGFEWPTVNDFRTPHAIHPSQLVWEKPLALYLI